MTDLDLFAAHALNGILANDNSTSYHVAAEQAFLYAKEMVRKSQETHELERKKWLEKEKKSIQKDKEMQVKKGDKDHA